MSDLAAIQKSAVISECGQYRYLLTRRWAKGPSMLWIMLNPSTADASEDDPTIRRCLGFARRWGFESLEVVNLFAVRATDRTVLTRTPDPVGAENDRYIQEAAARAGLVVVAWGTWGSLFDRQATVAEALAWCPLYCLGKTSSGFPRHPLYVRGDAERMVWRCPDGR
jgi:hypothetical protein